MANPEMSSAQEQSLGAVPPQGAVVEAEVGAEAGASPEVSAGQPEPSEFSDAPAPQSAQAPRPKASAAHPHLDPAGRTLPLIARVLLADFGVAIVTLIALTVIEVQRMGEASLHLRRQAYVEDLVVLFVVAAVFGLVTFLLFRAGRTRVGLVQAVVTAVVLSVAVTSAITGNPKPVTVEQDH